MKKHIFMMTTALVIGVSAPVAAQDDLAGFSDGIMAMANSQGATVSFDERNVGADGSVEYVGFWLSAPEGEMTVRADWVKGVPSATTPGQVTFTLSPDASVTIQDPDSGEHIINIANEGLTITVDGITSGHDAAELNYSVEADSLSFTSGKPDDEVLRALNVVFTNLSQTVSFTQASKLLRGETGLSMLSMLYDIHTPHDGDISSDGQIEDFQFGFQIIADDDESNFFDYLSGATTAFVEMSASSSAVKAKLTGPDARITYSGTSEGFNLAARAENGWITVVEEVAASQYAFSEFNIEGTPLPPFDISLDEFALKLTLPTVDHGGFEEANAVIALRGLEVSESIYSMFDPAQAIPRSAINAVIDMSANVQSQVDWSMPMAAATGNPNDVGLVQDITINEVLFTAGGAQVTAEGGATVDNSGPFPFPTGKVTITVAGAQALVNSLVQIGLIPQDQAGMAMGMVMAFARPGNAADEFISDIEFSPQGITANGVPLPM